MKTILIAQEMGSGLGHIGVLLPIALKLKEQGYNVVFLVKDIVNVSNILDKHDFKYFSFPHSYNTNYNRVIPDSYCDMLFPLGYGDVDKIYSVVKAFSNIVDVVKTDLVIINHSSTANIACHLLSIPYLNIGTGFELPPKTHPLPPIKTWSHINEDRLIKLDKELVNVINEVSRLLKSDISINIFSDIFTEENRVLTIFEEFDHYTQHRTSGRNYIGPIFNKLSDKKLYWKSKHSKKVLIYLNSNADGFNYAIHALLNNPRITTDNEDMEVVVITDYRNMFVNKYTNVKNIRFFTGEYDISSLLKSCNLVICKGGMGVVSQSLLAGVPLCIFSQNPEQYTTGLRIEKLELGINIRNYTDINQIVEDIYSLLNYMKYKYNAHNFFKKYISYNCKTTIDYCVNKATELLKC
jgi:UDP:flavonoid glycosyltransferase YjiC (YdhE family)